MIQKILKFIVIGTLGLSLITASTLSVIIQPVVADEISDREAQLRAQLDDVLRQIADQQKVLVEEQGKGQTIERDIAILTAKIQEAQLKIRAHNLAIEGLGKDINVKTQTITTLTEKISNNQESLAQLVRKTNELDAFTMTDVVLSNQNISSFFADVDALDTIKESIQIALGNIKASKNETEVAKKTLDKKRLEEIDARISVEAEQAKIKKNEAEKARLLSLSKAQQKSYLTEIKKKESQAASIRAALFSLRDTSAIPFGRALDYATAASAKTGVRPAFLLAILTQESNLGKNVGSCFVTNLTTGDGVKVTSGEIVTGIMKPTRDIAPFQRILEGLGREPSQTRVSCPFSTGYGGAMGPSQFIPSTWELFQTRIAQALGKSMADPWNPEDAFMASGIYLGDLGASTGAYSAERNAACRYYSGRSCDSKKPANTFYGDQVMAKANDIQINMIDPLSGN